MLEVFDRHLVIAHVLVDKPTLNVHSLILGQLLHYSSELCESFLEFSGLPEHETLMEHRTNETLVTLQCITKRLNSVLNQLILELKSVLSFLS